MTSKVTIVNTHDLVGGAERASYDLALGLHRRGVDARLYVAGQYGFDAFTRRFHYRAFDYRPRAAAAKYLGLTDTTLWEPLRACLRYRDFREADVVNIHNMHGGYWNFWSLPVLAKSVPIVLTLHDEWFITGDCAYTYDCERWLNGCGRCPQHSGALSSNRYALGGRDATRLNLVLKKAAAACVPVDRMVIVAPSRWLLSQAERSQTLSRFRQQRIVYGLDLEQYRPRSRLDCARKLGLPLDKRLAFCAASSLGDPRKRYDQLIELARGGHLSPDLVLVCAGREGGQVFEEGLPIRYLGFLSGRDDMVEAISACHFSIVLSRADNLPYVSLESLACGRPVLGSAVGGIPEMVVDGETGWLLPGTVDGSSLARKLGEISGLGDDTLDAFAVRARNWAERNCAMRDYLSAHEQLFAEVAKTCA